MRTIKSISSSTAVALVCMGIAFVISACEDSGATYNFVCEHGTVANGTTSDNNVTKCTQCDSGYKLVSEVCMPTAYSCTNGTPPDGSPNGNQDVAQCSECDTGYKSSGDICMIVDTDNDGIPNHDDIDDDNDGLIEIDSLVALHNIRYNLAGTSYDDEADDSTDNEGDTTGAPTASNTADDYVCGAGATGTCGYELTTDLSFDADGDGSTWTVSGGSYTLDSDDDNDTYFDIESGGWAPIGDIDNGFDAIFDGNNYTITGVAIRRSDTLLGLFGAITDDSTVQKLTVEDSMVAYTGTDGDADIAIIAGRLGNSGDMQSVVTLTNVHITGTSHIVGGAVKNTIGGLAGFVENATITSSSSNAMLFGAGAKDRIGGLIGEFAEGSITASYATGAIDGRSDRDDFVGGLVGYQSGGTISVCYATGAVNGGEGGFKNSGGLVGYNTNGTIIASYATGAVHGGTDDYNNAGGLVGFSANGTIIASYATGDVIDGDGSNGVAGGLVGYQTAGAIIASYATGTTDGGAGILDTVGGLIGFQAGGTVSASYATSDVAGGDGSSDYGGKLIGYTGRFSSGTQSTSYGFGTVTAENHTNHPYTVDVAPLTGDNTPDPAVPNNASGLTSNYFTGTIAENAWSFSDEGAPKLLYADYDGNATDYSCTNILLEINGITVMLACGDSKLAGQ